MPFLAPLIPVIAGIASAGAGVAGAVEGAKAGGRQQKALSIQEQIAQQEEADRQQAFKQLTDFFSPYLKAGSPFLQMIQRAAAESNATQANNAAGAVRSEVGRSGLGYGPSGTEAAALGGVATEAAKTGSANYLENLLNNEMIKFNAAKGIESAGAMAGSPQNQPNVSATLPYNSLGSGLTGLSQVLANLLKGSGSGTDYSGAGNAPNIPSPTTIPNPPPTIPPTTFPTTPPTVGTPTTQGLMT